MQCDFCQGHRDIYQRWVLALQNKQKQEEERGHFSEAQNTQAELYVLSA